MSENIFCDKYLWQLFPFVLGTITVFLPHNLTRDVRIVQSKENTLPVATKSLELIMVLFDLIAGNYFVHMEKIAQRLKLL